MLHLQTWLCWSLIPARPAQLGERGCSSMDRGESWLWLIGPVHPFIKMNMNPPAMGNPSSANVNKVTTQAWRRLKYLITSLVFFFFGEMRYTQGLPVSFGLFSNQQEFPHSCSDLISTINTKFPPAGSVMIFRVLCPKKDPMEAASSLRTASLISAYPGVWGAPQGCSIPSPHQDPVQTSPSYFTY